MDFGAKSGAQETLFSVFWDAFGRGMRQRRFDENITIYCIEWTLGCPLAAKFHQIGRCKAFQKSRKKKGAVFNAFSRFSVVWDPLSGTMLGAISLFFEVLKFSDFFEYCKNVIWGVFLMPCAFFVTFGVCWKVL